MFHRESNLFHFLKILRTFQWLIWWRQYLTLIKGATLRLYGLKSLASIFEIRSLWSVSVFAFISLVLSIFVKYFFQVSFNLKEFFVHGKNNSKYRDGAPLARGGGGGYLTKFNTGRLRPEVQPLTLSYTILAEKLPLLYSTFYWSKVPLSHTYFRKSCSHFHAVLNK